MTLDWLTYTRHVLTCCFQPCSYTQYFLPIMSMSRLPYWLPSFFIPFLFEQAKMKQKTKWTLNLPLHSQL